jgi:hypothetical protein
MVRGGLGANPLVWSHGQEKGPIFVRHSVEDAFHSGPSQALRIKLPVPPKPKPAPWRWAYSWGAWLAYQKKKKGRG